MKNIFVLGIFILAELTTPASFAQKKVTVLGSSTAAGSGVTAIDSAWVWRLRAYFNKNSGDQMDTIVNNRAVGGYVTYKSLPDGYPIPPNRPEPDQNANVTYVLNDLPKADVVIINYPTNDIANNYDPKEMMDNLRVMFQQFNANNIRCYIATSQPRNTVSDEQRTILRQLVDSIIINFGNYAINFWDDLVTNDGLNMIRPEVNSGDGIHVNDLGHRLLFEKVEKKNIFGLIVSAPLPLGLKNWQGRLENNLVKLNWNTRHEEPGTRFEIQRSTNGTDFQTLTQINGKGQDAEYSWTDASPLNGKSFYRLKIIESLKTSYSGVFPIVNDKKQLVVSFYTDVSHLHLQLNSDRGHSASLTLINSSGIIIKKQTISITGSDSISVPIAELPSGNYFLKITTSQGATAVERFAKLK